MTHPAQPDRRALLAGATAALAILPGMSFAAPIRLREPGCLNAHCGAWDRKRRACFVFGGADERQVLGSFWELRQGSWRGLPPGPGPRTFASAAFDTVRGRFILFGGNRVLFGREGATDTLLDDHWEWDGRRWSRFDGPRPAARTEAAMAFDERRGRTVMFGGWQWRDGQRVRLRDLWEFDGRAWTELAAKGPEPRSGSAMTFDPPSRQILLVGGNGPRSDVWSLDSSGWHRLADLPQGRFNPALAFDRGSQAPLLFGGWTGRERIAATIVLKGGEWRSVGGPQPPPRNHSLLVPSGDGSRLLLIGGHDGDAVFADRWEWHDRWRVLRTSAPRLRIENGH